MKRPTESQRNGLALQPMAEDYNFSLANEMVRIPF